MNMTETDETEWPPHLEALVADAADPARQKERLGGGASAQLRREISDGSEPAYNAANDLAVEFRAMSLPGSPKGIPLTGTIGRTTVIFDAETGKLTIAAPALPREEKASGASHPKSKRVGEIWTDLDRARWRSPKS